MSLFNQNSFRRKGAAHDYEIVNNSQQTSINDNFKTILNFVAIQSLRFTQNIKSPKPNVFIDFVIYSMSIKVPNKHKKEQSRNIIV